MFRDREGSNGGPDGKAIHAYLREIDKADDQLLKLKSEHMTACKGPRARIRSTMKEARAGGANMAALRLLIAEHRNVRRIDAQIAELERDDRADYEAMLAALGEFGETDLGKAALAKAAPKDGGDKLYRLRPV